MTQTKHLLAAAIGLIMVALPYGGVAAQPATGAWLDTSQSADARADAAVAAMSRAEKLQLVFGWFSTGTPLITYKG